MIAALLTQRMSNVGQQENPGRGNVITATRSLPPVTQIGPDDRGVGQEVLVDPREINRLRDPDLDRGQNLVLERKEEEKTVTLVHMPIGIADILKKRVIEQRTTERCRQ